MGPGGEIVPRLVRRSRSPRGKLMDLASTTLLFLLSGSLGVFGLFRLLQRMRGKAYLKDAVVVITGATSGLGKECAKAFHAAGSKLVLCGRNGERLQDLLRELSAAAGHPKNPHKHHTVIFDLSDIKAVVNAAGEILKCVDHVDILINNAGISYRGTILDTVVEVDRKVMETNYFGPIALTKAILPSMIKRRQGHIVAISSVQGKIGIPFRSALMDKTTREGAAAAEVAQAVLHAVGEKKKEVLIAGFLPALAVYLRTLCPRLFFTAMAARARKEKKAKDS
ncbi:dehydrogenase/reductase SDR family member 7B isoform X2 [Hemicordylus capensis]|uniref:dehydrogenase/reductase SDR family member 7B isoform X2 n=1 Tax=Hemicordylus capensis TaxID=884348 RepID=UPI0023047C68|nr:dehydrogenase/reductase SDR family member 7B isoform X2 [Hemicordylus capensis]